MPALNSVVMVQSDDLTHARKNRRLETAAGFKFNGGVCIIEPEWYIIYYYYVHMCVFHYFAVYLYTI